MPLALDNLRVGRVYRLVNYGEERQIQILSRLGRENFRIKDLATLEDFVRTETNRGSFVIILGGSHDLSLGHCRAYSKLDRSFSVLNMDSHPDVREPINDAPHSGSPFYQAMTEERSCMDQYTVWGLSRWSTSKTHIDFLRENECDYHFCEQVTPELVQKLYTLQRTNALASFDLDAIDQSAAPGVSAPAARGVSAELYYQAMLETGRNPAFRSVDIVELNPDYDIDARTARVASVGLWHLYLGLCERHEKGFLVR